MTKIAISRYNIFSCLQNEHSKTFQFWYRSHYYDAYAFISSISITKLYFGNLLLFPFILPMYLINC